MVLGKCDEKTPRRRGRFTLEDSTGVDVKEIMYVVIECILNYGNKALKQ